MDSIFGIPVSYIGSTFRHALTAGAGALVASGWATQDQGNALVTGAMALIGIGWSWWQKYSHAKEVAAASGKTIAPLKP